MNDLSAFAELVPLDHGLCVVVTRRADHTPHSTVVNAGVVPHPTTGALTVAFVSAGSSRKLVNLRADPTVAIVVRAGWRWAAVEGHAHIIGPGDPDPDVGEERLRALLRDIFSAAGGTHEDWATFDRVMREERRAAVLITPTRITTNPA